MSDIIQHQAILNKSSVDKFVLYLGLPPILQKINSSNQKDRSGKTVDLQALQFSVHGSLIPASYVPHTETRYGGQTLKVTTNSRPAYPNITVKFVVDNGWRNYFLLWKWLSVINDQKISIYNADHLQSPANQLKNLHDYMVDLVVYVKDEYDKNVAMFTYTKAFITRLEGVDQTYQDNGQIESSFEFAFSQFYMDLL